MLCVYFAALVHFDSYFIVSSSILTIVSLLLCQLFLALLIACFHASLVASIISICFLRFWLLFHLLSCFSPGCVTSKLTPCLHASLHSNYFAYLFVLFCTLPWSLPSFPAAIFSNILPLCLHTFLLFLNAWFVTSLDAGTHNLLGCFSLLLPSFFSYLLVASLLPRWDIFI